jgi:histidine ammonia-lyase
MKKAGLNFYTPNRVEGLSLINGPHIMTGELALRCYDARNLMKNAVIASAMTIDVLHVSREVLDPLVHELRMYPGQRAVAENVRRITVDSTIKEFDWGAVPDSYSLQCTPQILGPALDALAYVTHQVNIEMNAASDDHLFLEKERVCLSAGHVHDQPIAMAADFLSIAMTEVTSLSERHVNRLLNPAFSGLPAFLVEGEGLITGLASAQHTAASLVSENRVLSHPGVVDSISISADRKDHVSMGPIAVRKLRQIIANVAAVIAIEMLCAAQAVDFRKPRKPGRGSRAAYRAIRKVVTRLEDDRPLYPDIQRITKLVLDGSIVKAVERATGPLSVGDYPY